MTHINTPSSRRGNTRTRSFKNDDMIKKLSGLIEGQRVGVFIDAANLYFGTSSKGIHISYEAIIDWFRTHTKSCFLNFYTAYKPEETKQTDFLAEMENLGYRIVKKPVKIFADNNMKGNLDIELAVDSIELRDTFDVYILISGDGDFQYVFQKLKGYGKTTLLIGVGGFTSFELHAEADHYFLSIESEQCGKKRSASNRNRSIMYLSIKYLKSITLNHFRWSYSQRSKKPVTWT